jgi:hypothetical protein
MPERTEHDGAPAGAHGVRRRQPSASTMQGRSRLRHAKHHLALSDVRNESTAVVQDLNDEHHGGPADVQRSSRSVRSPAPKRRQE